MSPSIMESILPSSSSASSPSSPRKTSPPSLPQALARAAVKLSLVAGFSLFALAAYGTAFGPYPAECPGLAGRWEYNKQLVLTMTQIQAEWDLPRLFSAMNASCRFQDASTGLAPYQLQPLGEIDAATDPSWRAKLRSAIVDKREAVVVRNLRRVASDMFSAEANEWDLAYLERKLFPADTHVPVFMDYKRDDTMQWIPFSELADELRKRNSTSKYGRCLPDRGGVLHGNMNISNIAAAIHKEVPFQMTHFLGGGLPACLFVSSNLVRTRAHSDTQSNAFVMLEGRKRWFFFPPSESMYLIPTGQGFNLAYNSLIDVFKRDDPDQQARFPLLKHAKGFETVINAGDVLFHPSFWWHGVQNLDDISVGLDIPFIDPVTGFSMNPVLDVGTVLTPVVNPKALSLLLWELLTTADTNVKEVFFHGYYRDDKERENAKRFRELAREAKADKATRQEA